MPLTKVDPKMVGAGSVLQVVSTIRTDYISTTSTSWVDWFSVSITPNAATSKVLVTLNSSVSNDTSNSFQYVRLLRNGTVIAQGDAVGSATRCWIDGALGSLNTYAQTGKNLSGSFVDSPASTSVVTYTAQVIRTANGTAYFGRPADVSDANRGAVPSVLTAMEIAG